MPCVHHCSPYSNKDHAVLTTSATRTPFREPLLGGQWRNTDLTSTTLRKPSTVTDLLPSTIACDRVSQRRTEPMQGVNWSACTTFLITLEPQCWLVSRRFHSLRLTIPKEKKRRFYVECGNKHVRMHAVSMQYTYRYFIHTIFC